MSIYIKNTPKKEELEFLLVLKYGKFNTGEFLDKIPETVIEQSYSEIEDPNRSVKMTVEQKKQIIDIYHRTPDYKKRVERIVLDNLAVYHSLLGTL